jgi:signal transduction histidine kinase
LKDDLILLKSAIYKAFPGISELEVNKLIRQGVVSEYPKNFTLCIEGNEEDIFYILLEGEVRVTKKINSEDDRLLNYLKPGGFFGEMGLINDAPRAATVTTTARSKVLEIDRGNFTEVLQKSGTVSLAMVREVSQRLRENDEMAIEDLREKAQELADAYQKLAELEAARREFLTTIAHELRTPLTSANGLLQLIRMNPQEGENLTKALDTIGDNLQRIVALTNDILFLQEMDLIFTKYEEVNVKSILEEVVMNEQDFSEKMGVNVHLQMNELVPAISGNRESLVRSFAAIVNNAIKFSINGGDILVSLTKNKNYAIISIQDQGIGIKPEDLQKIFERFWRLDAYNGHLFDGIGLGLSIAKQVVKQHSGTITVSSTLGKGSNFVVKLPLRSD